MRKRLFQIALLALCWPRLASASINVPQMSAADYIFSQPVLTNHIRGVLVDTTNAYRVIRSEDADWLLEAYAERFAICAGGFSGSSPGVGTVVGRDDTIFDLGGSEWLDPDAQLLNGARLVPTTRTTTNTYSQTTYTNGFSNAVSRITMPMTNGTVSVYTNRWIVTRRFPVESVTTNVHEWSGIDYCHAVEGVPFPAYSNVYALSWGYFNETYAMFPSVKSIAHAREILRGTKRLADDDCLWTNDTLTITKLLYGDSPPIVSTNFGNASYDFAAAHTYANITRTDPFTARVPTRFSSSLVTTGGANRVSVEAVFAKCDFSHYHGTGYNTGTYLGTNAIIRLGVASLDLSGTTACCLVSVDPLVICAACASVAGVNSPPTSDDYRSSEGTYETWHTDIDSIILFYSINPSVKLPDW